MSGPWPKERIPGADFLYMRVHKDDVDEEGVPEPRIFRNHLDERGIAAMSTDWSKYCRPEDTQQRARRRPPVDHGVIALNVGTVRTIPRQVVEHAPIFREPEEPANSNNRAHTNVLGPKSPKDDGGDIRIRALYVAAAAATGWAIQPPPA